jgi:putative acetyltransferase
MKGHHGARVDQDRRSAMLCRKITVRQSRKSDETAVAVVQTEAFGRTTEATLTLTLIAARLRTISLVAECNAHVVGHILFSEIVAPVKSLALAPLAVLPEYREMQVGTSLVREGIVRARKLGYDAVFVLGDPDYYQRFGFSGALAGPFEVPWKGPNFMALEIREGSLAGKAGKLVYPAEFLGI